MRTKDFILLGAGYAAGRLSKKINAGPIGATKKKYPSLREVKVTYSNGDVVYTSMAASLTDQDIKNYFRIGKKFNVGSGGKDKMAKVKKVEILK